MAGFLLVLFCCTVSCDFCSDPYVVESSDGVVNKEALAEPWVEHAKAHVIVVWVSLRCDGIGVRPWVEGVTVDTRGGVSTALDCGDTFAQDVADESASSFTTPFVNVVNGVVIGVLGVESYPST
jgi:hypothetical protein